MMPIFRIYEARDGRDVLALLAQLGYEHKLDLMVGNIAAVRQQNGEIFVAELDGRVCGCISAIIDVRLAEGMNGEIVSLVVSEEARGHGVGKGLVAVAEEWLSSRTPKIRIRANTVRAGAHQFYRKLGYAPLKEQLVFEKTLALASL